MHQYRLTPHVEAQKNNTSVPDVMGYHTAAEIPNYWTYASQFTLDDHMFEPVKSWSLPDHLALVSGWSAKCKNKKASSCKNDIAYNGAYDLGIFDKAVAQEMAGGTTNVNLAWTDLTWLLFKHHVSWGYYVQTGSQPDCANDSALTCSPVAAELPDLRHLEPPAPLHRCTSRPPRKERPTAGQLPHAGPQRDPAIGVVGHAGRPEQRAPARKRASRPGVRDLGHQLGDGGSRLEVQRHLLGLGRLGWVQRPRETASRRPKRLRLQQNEESGIQIVQEQNPLPKFEECLQRLEKIVQELEKGEVPLEKSLTLFKSMCAFSRLPQRAGTGGR